MKEHKCVILLAFLVLVLFIYNIYLLHKQEENRITQSEISSKLDVLLEGNRIILEEQKKPVLINND